VAAGGVHLREIGIRSCPLAAWLVKMFISITIAEGLCQALRDISVLFNRTVAAERACFQMRLSGYGACTPSALRLQRFCKPKQWPHAHLAACTRSNAELTVDCYCRKLVAGLPRVSNTARRLDRAGSLIASVSVCPFRATQRAAEPHLTRMMHDRR
jgi:hypothetical protein